MKLNLGGGNHEIEGYINVDIKNGLSVYPLYYDDNSVDEIRASHILEHFSMKLVPHVLKDWVRVLKPNGIIKIAVPDIVWIANELMKGNPRELPLAEFIMGGQIDKYDFHKSVFNYETLKTKMIEAGLVDIEYWDDDIQDCSSLEVSLNLMGRKANGDR